MRPVEHEFSVVTFVREFLEIRVVNAIPDMRAGWGCQLEHDSAKV
jgi:hypothetical protein